jgi:hypothetical protein
VNEENEKKIEMAPKKVKWLVEMQCALYEFILDLT